jgi:hypothetical protein
MEDDEEEFGSDEGDTDSASSATSPSKLSPARTVVLFSQSTIMKPLPRILIGR